MAMLMMPFTGETTRCHDINESPDPADLERDADEEHQVAGGPSSDRTADPGLQGHGCITSGALPNYRRILRKMEPKQARPAIFKIS